MPCNRFTSSQLIPAHLRGLKRGVFGIVNGPLDKKARFRMREHHQNLLHIECKKMYKKEFNEEKESREKNRNAATMIVSNCIAALKEPGGGSKYFLKLNEKDSINPCLKNLTATKNDGQQLFFEIRDIACQKLENKIKKLISSKNSIGISLDKVTLFGRSYTVIITFCFHEGVLHYFLSDLFVMSSGK